MHLRLLKPPIGGRPWVKRQPFFPHSICCFHSPSSLKAERLVIHPRFNAPSVMPKLEDLRFGNFFTDYMLEVDWDSHNGWHAPHIKPTTSISIHPASSGLHYGIQAFEGLKCFYGDDGKSRLFRPFENMKRFNRSAERLALPTCDPSDLLQLLKKLINMQKHFIPNVNGFSLYIRPLLFSTQPTLGVGPASSAKLIILLNPCGPYYASGFKPIQLWAELHYIRSFAGGSGDYKIGSNYAPTILPQLKAIEKGYSQILWMTPSRKEDDFLITEVGTMNFFVVWINERGEKELATPALQDNLILPGVTRDSILELAKMKENVKVYEGPILFKHQFLKAYDENRILEVFGAGTASSISPIKAIAYEDTILKFSTSNVESTDSQAFLSTILLKELIDIQKGRKVFKDWALVV